MDEKSLLISAIVVVLIVIALIVLVISMTRKNSNITNNIKNEKNALTEIIRFASNKSRTNQELMDTVARFANEFPFPPKHDGKVPDEAKKYLNFVLTITSHKAANAKLIVFMNKELKEVNIGYSSEIDEYENEGLKNR